MAGIVNSNRHNFNKLWIQFGNHLESCKKAPFDSKDQRDSIVEKFLNLNKAAQQVAEHFKLRAPSFRSLHLESKKLFDLSNVKKVLESLDKLKDTITKKAPYLKPKDLFEAVSRGDIESVQAFLEAGEDVNLKTKYEKKAPLHLAAENGDARMIKALLEAKADINLKSQNYRTPLHCAADKGHVLAIRALKEAGATLYSGIFYEDSIVRISFHNACLGNINIVKAFLEAGVYVNCRDNNFRIPLHTAVFMGKLDIVKVLLEAKSEINAKDDFGETPLHKAVIIRRLDIVRVLLGAKADVSIQDREGQTALQYAEKKGLTEIIKVLKAAEVV